MSRYKELSEEQKLFIADTYKKLISENQNKDRNKSWIIAKLTLIYNEHFKCNISASSINKYMFYKPKQTVCDSSLPLFTNDELCNYVNHIKHDFVLEDGTYATRAAIYDIAEKIQRLYGIIQKQHTDLVMMRK